MDASAWIAGIATFVAVVSAGFALGSWREAKRSADASVRSARAAEDTVALTREEQESANRARLRIHDPEFRVQSPGEAIVSFRLRNIGRASAHGMTISTNGNTSGSLKLGNRPFPRTLAPEDEFKFGYRIQFPLTPNAPNIEFAANVLYSDPSREDGSATVSWSIPSDWEKQVRNEDIGASLSEDGQVVRTLHNALAPSP